MTEKLGGGVVLDSWAIQRLKATQEESDSPLSHVVPEMLSGKPAFQTPISSDSK